MKIADMKLIYEYNFWVNKLLLDTAEKLTPAQFTLPTSFSWGNLHKTFLHLLDTEYGWRVLCQHGQITFDLKPEDFPDLASIRRRWQTEEAAMWDYLNTLTDEALQGIVSYQVEGNTRNRVLWHCLWHLVNHGTQHRSECAAMLTDFGHSPGDVDFTLFLNQR